MGPGLSLPPPFLLQSHPVVATGIVEQALHPPGLQLGVGPPGPSWPGLAHLVGSEPGQG